MTARILLNHCPGKGKFKNKKGTKGLPFVPF
jgi:hypothetical protein